MSFSFEQVRDQAEGIARIAAKFLCEEVLLTNKRVVYRFSKEPDASIFAQACRVSAFYCWVEKGLKTDRWYVQVDFNYPTGG